MLHGSRVGTSQELAPSASTTSKPCPRRIDASNERSVCDKPTIRRHGFRAIIVPPIWFPNSTPFRHERSGRQEARAPRAPIVPPCTRGLGESPAQRRQTALMRPACVETPTRSSAPTSCFALGDAAAETLRRGVAGHLVLRTEQPGETTAPRSNESAHAWPKPPGVSARGVTWGMTLRSTQPRLRPECLRTAHGERRVRTRGIRCVCPGGAWAPGDLSGLPCHGLRRPNLASSRRGERPAVPAPTKRNGASERAEIARQRSSSPCHNRPIHSANPRGSYHIARRTGNWCFSRKLG
jgi:hypothetical protein